MHTNPYSRKLRRQSTRPEQLLWLVLRNRGFDGLKVRRQHAVGKFIADFVCIERKLIIELDGAAHDIDFVRDERRDAWLASQGFQVIRFMNDDVTRNLEGVVETIREALAQTARPLTPQHPLDADVASLSPLRGARGQSRKG